MWEINCNSYRGQKQNFEKKVKNLFWKISKILFVLNHPRDTLIKNIYGSGGLSLVVWA